MALVIISFIGDEQHVLALAGIANHGVHLGHVITFLTHVSISHAKTGREGRKPDISASASRDRPKSPPQGE